MKITNYQALVLLELEDTEFENGVWRPELAEQLNTPITTLYDNLKRLQIKELVENYGRKDEEYGERSEKRGRNRTYWYITDLGKRAVRVIRRGME